MDMSERLAVFSHSNWARWWCVWVLALCAAPSAYAYQNDAMLERDGTRCLEQISRAERKYGIPSRLLHSIALTETGRLHRASGKKIPWPWSINVEGKPYLYATKREAVIAVEAFRRRGITSIDVGCMQINLRHHPDAFANISQAFEPSYNVDYAARFLQSNYKETGVWRNAVGQYHSRTPGHAARYIGNVYQQWGKLAQATARANGGQQMAMRVKYPSYIRNETTGVKGDLGKEKRVEVASLDKKQEPSAYIIRPKQTHAPVKANEINVIKVKKPLVTVETAPTQDVAAAQSPVISMEDQEKGFTNIAVGSNAVDRMAENVQFIRFVE